MSEMKSGENALTLYGAYISPASRPVLQLLSAANIPFQLHEINIFKKEQMSPDYLKINPSHTIPSLIVGDRTSPTGAKPFVLFQSAAIMRYLCTIYEKEAGGYLPSTPEADALVEQYLTWHTLNIEWLRNKLINNPDKELTAKLEHNLSIVENHFLTDVSPWLYGNPNLTIADIALFNELISIEIFKELDLSPYKRISRQISSMLATSHGKEIKEKLYQAAHDLGL